MIIRFFTSLYRVVINVATALLVLAVVYHLLFVFDWTQTADATQTGQGMHHEPSYRP